MANILQVTPVGINTENRVAGSQEAEQQVHSQNVRNPSDPGKVTRADGQQGGKTGTATQEGRAGAVHYESNYGAFIKELSESQESQGALRRLLMNLLEPSVQWAERLQEGMPAAFVMASQDEAAKKLKDQAAIQTRFSGRFFDSLRSFLSEYQGRVPQEAELFLKAYADYTAGPHLLRQMKTLADDIGKLMLRQPAGEWKEMTGSMDWAAPRGETETNAGTLNGRLIPFLASYISKTHDYGGVRSAVMLFIFHAVRYENGSLENLTKTFDRIAVLMQDKGLLPEAKEEVLRQLTAGQDLNEARQMADQVTEELFKMQDGLDGSQQSQNITRGLLVNESVFMPLVHLIFPFRIEDQEVVSEMWIDPDADREKDQGEGRKIKLLLKFDIRRLGEFELVMSLQDRKAGLHLYVPSGLLEQKESISGEVEEILRNNGFRPIGVQVEQKVREGRIQDIFPGIRQKERVINVRI